MDIHNKGNRRAIRMAIVENALASARMEGLEPSQEAHGIFQQYVDGELSLEAMGRAVDRLLDRQYGPVRLSRNDRS